MLFENFHYVSLFDKFLHYLSTQPKFLDQQEIQIIQEFKQIQKEKQHVLIRMFLRKPIWFKVQDLQKYDPHLQQNIETLVPFVLGQQEIMNEFQLKLFLEFFFDLDNMNLKEIKSFTSKMAHDKSSLKLYPPNFFNSLHTEDPFLQKNFRKIGDLQQFEFKPKINLIFDIIEQIDYFTNTQSKQQKQFFQYFQKSQGNNKILNEIKNYFKQDYEFLCLKQPLQNIFEKSINLYFFFQQKDLSQIDQSDLKPYDDISVFSDRESYQKYAQIYKIRTYLEENDLNEDQILKLLKVCHIKAFDRKIPLQQLGTAILLQTQKMIIPEQETILERYNEKYEYIKLLHFYAEEIEKMKKYSLAIYLYVTLLGQSRLQSKRGFWAFRASFLCKKYLNEPQITKSILSYMEKDNNIQSGNKIKILKLQQEQPKFNVSHFNLKARVIDDVTQKKLRYYYLDQTNQPSSVENIALNHYKEKGYEGAHCENYILGCLYGLFFIDLIYPCVQSQQKNERFPPDMFLNCFYQNRQKILDERLDFIEGLQTNEIKEFANNQWEKYEQKQNIFINWSDSFFQKDVTCNVASYFKGYQLRAIFEKFAKSYKLWRSGMPDLFLFKQENIFLVEVKSENDKLSEQQIAWIQIFNQIEIPYEICHISSKNGTPI